MRRFLAQHFALCALPFVLVLAHIGPASADGLLHRHHGKHHAHVAYTDFIPYYEGCRIGWWQTLRYGHVRPRWGVGVGDSSKLIAPPLFYPDSIAPSLSAGESKSKGYLDPGWMNSRSMR